MAFLDLQGMKSATQAPGGSNLSVTSCTGPHSGISVICGSHSSASLTCN